MKYKKKKLLGSMFGKSVSKREKETRRWYSSVIASAMFKTIFGKGVMTAGTGVLKARRGYKNIDHIDKKVLVPIHLLSNIEITKYCHYKPRFNGAFSRDNLPRINDGIYVLNPSDKLSKETHWFSLFIDRTYLNI